MREYFSALLKPSCGRRTMTKINRQEALAQEAREKVRKPLTLEEGMTLRDYFAAKAMQGMLANPKLQEQILKAGQSWIEKSAWSVADAMLKERNNAN